jgi:hypothetical protein
VEVWRSRRPGGIAAALALVGASNPPDEIFVVNFNNRVRRGLPSDVLFSDDIQSLRKALWVGNSEGGTSYMTPWITHCSTWRKAGMDKKTLAVVSDGGDNASIVSRKDIMHKCKSLPRSFIQLISSTQTTLKTMAMF